MYNKKQEKILQIFGIQRRFWLKQRRLQMIDGRNWINIAIHVAQINLESYYICKHSQH